MHASAQSPTGSHVDRAARQIPAERFGQIRADFGRCVYRAFSADIDRLLGVGDSITPGKLSGRGLSWEKLAASNGFRNCVGEAAPGNEASTLRFSTPVFRSLMQEQAYQRAAPAGPPAAPAGPLPARTFASEGDALPQAQVYGRLADCVVQEDAAHADALVRTNVGSPQELTAARALAPALGNCVTAGQNITLNATSIRLLAADGLWQRFAAVTPATSQ